MEFVEHISLKIWKIAVQPWMRLHILYTVLHCSVLLFQLFNFCELQNRTLICYLYLFFWVITVLFCIILVFIKNYFRIPFFWKFLEVFTDICSTVVFEFNFISIFLRNWEKSNMSIDNVRYQLRKRFYSTFESVIIINKEKGFMYSLLYVL